MSLKKTCNICFIEKSLDLFPKAITCKDGHRNYCKSCKKEKGDIYRKNNLEAHKERGKRWVDKNPEKRKDICRKYNQKNKEKYSKYKKEYALKNKDKININTSIRRKRIRESTVSWDKEFTLFVFKEAHTLRILRNKITNFKWNVDHVVPLRGKNVCGLHVWNNFAVIPQIENNKKLNKWE